jgi:hypothetical protein
MWFIMSQLTYIYAYICDQLKIYYSILDQEYEYKFQVLTTADQSNIGVKMIRLRTSHRYSDMKSSI